MWKQPECLLAGEWINNMQYRHTMEYSTMKRNGTLIGAAWMNLENSRLRRDIRCKRPRAGGLGASKEGTWSFSVR